MSDDVLKEHGGTVVAGAIALAIAGVQWLLGREVKRRDHVMNDHELRLRVVELNGATRTDIANIHTHLESMRKRAEERHLEVLDRINPP